MIRSEPHLLGLTPPIIGAGELVARISTWVTDGTRAVVLSGNAHLANLACQHAWLKEFANSQVSVIRLDGHGVSLALRILGLPVPSRATWADFAWTLSTAAAQAQWKLFFLGGRPGVADRAARRLSEANPGLRVVGTRDGYFDLSCNSPESLSVVAEVNRVRPDLLVVGLGMPLQERWLRDHFNQLDVSVALTGGAVFDYVSGRTRRPPLWMRRIGLEWLGRLALDPKRLWQRYLIGNPTFLLRVLRQRCGYVTRRRDRQARAPQGYRS